MYKQAPYPPTANMARRASRILAVLKARHPKGAVTTLMRVRITDDAQLRELQNALWYQDRRIVTYTWGRGWMKFRISQPRK